MLTFDVAYLSVADTDLILVPVAAGFAGWPPADQLAAVAEFEKHAAKGGLVGSVVPVWKNAAGRAVFLVRPSTRAAVESMTWEFVSGCVNYRLRITRWVVGPRSEFTREAVPAA